MFSRHLNRAGVIDDTLKKFLLYASCLVVELAPFLD